MRFQIEHRTTYRYGGAATESFMEARLTPVTDDRQRLIARELVVRPECPVSGYRDYFGNWVESFSIVHRHEHLELISRSEVETFRVEVPHAAVDLAVAEAQQLYRGERLHLYEFLATSAAIERTPEIEQLARRFFRSSSPLGESLLALNRWITDEFRYVPGCTRIDTPVSEVLNLRAGVCQDFAQLMIALLRASQIPARYVTGYIETESPCDPAAENTETPLVGSSESHAWVEAYLPGGFWWPLDPTNRCLADERHVKVASGRDYHDCTPTRGVFKGVTGDELEVAVAMRRAPAEENQGSNRAL